MAIPKVIHYCWFGGAPKPALAEKCIRSWKKHCPDYQIIEWNESNYDVRKCRYIREAYEAKKWAFVTDYARLDILHEHGGIYFDTDVELIKNLDKFLQDECFMCIEKSTQATKVNTGVGLGARAQHPLLWEMLEDYEEAAFIDENGQMDITTCTVRNTAILARHGFVEEDKLQHVGGAVIYPSEYFSPMQMESGLMFKTKNTHSIHHYGLSWTTPEKKAMRQKSLREIRRKNIIYQLKTLPNRCAIALLGRARYEKLKRKLKG